MPTLSFTFTFPTFAVSFVLVMYWCRGSLDRFTHGAEVLSRDTRHRHGWMNLKDASIVVQRRRCSVDQSACQLEDGGGIERVVFESSRSNSNVTRIVVLACSAASCTCSTRARGDTVRD